MKGDSFNIFNPLVNELGGPYLEERLILFDFAQCYTELTPWKQASWKHLVNNTGGRREAANGSALFSLILVLI